MCESQWYFCNILQLFTLYIMASVADQIWRLEIAAFQLDPLRNGLLLFPPPKSDMSSGFHRSRRVKRYIFQYLWISLCKSPGSSPPPLGVTATVWGGELLWHVQLATKSWLRLHGVGKPKWTSTYDGRVVVWESLRLFAMVEFDSSGAEIKTFNILKHLKHH